LIYIYVFSISAWKSIAYLGSCILGGLSSIGQMSRPSSQTLLPSSCLPDGAATAAAVLAAVRTIHSSASILGRLADGGGLKDGGTGLVARPPGEPSRLSLMMTELLLRPELPLPPIAVTGIVRLINLTSLIPAYYCTGANCFSQLLIFYLETITMVV